jgi:signal transduction histidine kinase
MSLSSRIIVRLAITTFVATAVAYGWLYLKQSRVQEYLRERALVRQAEEISHFISVNDDGSINVDVPPPLLEAYNNPGSRYRYTIRDEVGRIVATSGRRVGPLPMFMHGRHSTYEYNSEDAGARTVGAAFQTKQGERTFITQVEQTVPRVQSLGGAVFNEFITDGGWLGIPFLLALLGITALTVKKSLAPLDELAAVVANISPGSSEVRLPHVRIPGEILPLVHSINSALDRLDEGLRLQREFSADAAHQLRTPLAVLSANVDMLGDTAIAAKLRYDVELMSRIVSQLLLVARLETLNIGLDEQVDLRSAAREAAENLGPLAISMCKTLEADEPARPVFVRGNRPVIIAAVRNLIENGLIHSPTGGIVRIRVTSTPSIEVHDSGPGVPPEMRAKIFERFWRAENSKEGAGLGLSIVRRIMHALNGSVSVSTAPEGGAQFSLVFPAFGAATNPTRA